MFNTLPATQTKSGAFIQARVLAYPRISLNADKRQFSWLQKPRNEVRGSAWGIMAASSIFRPWMSKLPVKIRHTLYLVNLEVVIIKSVAAIAGDNHYIHFPTRSCSTLIRLPFCLGRLLPLHSEKMKLVAYL